MPSSRRCLLKYAVSVPWVAGCTKSKPDAQRPSNTDHIVDELRLAGASNLSKVVSRLSVRATSDELFQAAFMLPILTGGDVGDIHASAVVPSVRRLFAGFGKETTSRPLFWSIENAHFWARKDRVARRGPKPLREPSQALASALREGNVQLADQATASLVGAKGLETSAGILRLHCCQPRSDPHVAIFATQTSRMFKNLSPQHAALALRSVSRYAATRSRRLPQGAGNEGGETNYAFSSMARAVLQHRLSPSTDASDSLHTTTLFDALLTCHRAAGAAQKSLVLSRSNKWLRHRMGADFFEGAVAGTSERDRSSAPTLSGYSEALSSLRANQKTFLDEVKRALSTKAEEFHQFKYSQAVLDVSQVLEPRDRIQWLAQLGTVPRLGLFRG